MRITPRVQKVASGAALLHLLVCLVALAQVAEAQVPGTPVLQNAFVSPGLAFAGDFGSGGSGQSFFGAAAAWGLRGGRFQLSAAAGAQRSNGETRGAYGGRISANVWTSPSGLGAGAFVGVGGGPRTRTELLVTNPAILTVPAGLSLGYKRAMGTTRGWSVFVSPFYAWTRTDDGTAVSNSAFRFSTGLDFAFSQSFGLTLGGEFGGNQSSAAGNSFGAALTFVPGRR